MLVELSSIDPAELDGDPSGTSLEPICGGVERVGGVSSGFHRKGDISGTVMNVSMHETHPDVPLKEVNNSKFLTAYFL